MLRGYGTVLLAAGRDRQSVGIHARPMRNTVLFQLGTTVRPRTLARLLALHINAAVDWVNKARRHLHELLGTSPPR